MGVPGSGSVGGERFTPGRTKEIEVYWLHRKGAVGSSAESLSARRWCGGAAVTGQSKGVWEHTEFSLFWYLCLVVSEGLWLFRGVQLNEPICIQPSGRCGHFTLLRSPSLKPAAQKRPLRFRQSRLGIRCPHDSLLGFGSLAGAAHQTEKRFTY